MIHEAEAGKTDPLTGESRQYAFEHGGQNLNQSADELDALAADVSGLSPGMADARKEIARAEAAKEKAEAALRKQLAAKNEYQNRLQSIVTLKDEIGLASLALAEYQSCITSAASNFETWPFQVGQNNGRFGQWASSFALQILVAREMVQLLPDWIAAAQIRLETLEKGTEKFRVANKLD